MIIFKKQDYHSSISSSSTEESSYWSSECSRHDRSRCNARDKSVHKRHVQYLAYDPNGKPISVTFDLPPRLTYGPNGFTLTTG